ncbi:toll-like receptor Tollo [Panonychus citri]|uniref:toll-like receptor Tollo n=1 Tax=Panonychus citri TaxID=50023 RepID=UPI002306E7D6|nr:toll-like receptor Tollo [Panonychus citri]
MWFSSIISLFLITCCYLLQNCLVSPSALQHLKVINLASYKLKALPAHFFRESIELQELHLQNNSLTTLPSGLFTGLSKLLLLNLSYNEIPSESIDSDTFIDLIRMVLLDLSHNHLKTIDKLFFHSLYSLQKLNLAHNRISFIEDTSFSQLYNLHHLILDGNQLTIINSHTFSGPNVLRELSLNDNFLSSVNHDAFTNCSSLKDLQLSSNKLKEIPTAIYHLVELKNLHLSNNQISSINSSTTVTPILTSSSSSSSSPSSSNTKNNAFDIVNNLKHLTRLDLSNNKITNLTRNFFKDLPSLQFLDLSGNLLNGLEPGLFDDSASTLTTILLQDNNLTDINGLFINLINLKHLNVSRNLITWFEYALIPESLTVLDAHSNRIGELTNYYKVERFCTHLDFSFNLITKDLNSWIIPNTTETLFLNNNNLTTVLPMTFTDKVNLKHLDLRNNLISTLDMNAFRFKTISSTSLKSRPHFLISDNPFYCDCNMEWLQRVNKDTSLQYPVVMDLDQITCQLPFVRESTYLPLVKANSSNFLCKYKTHCFALCHCCEFDACDCKMTCPDNCTCYYDQTWSTNIVDCSRREYVHVPSRIPMDVTELYLDGNQLSTLSSHTFIGRKNMLTLYLNNSGIHSIVNRTFNGLQLLQVLHLEHNYITTLNGFEFESLSRLRELHLHHNRISFINNRTFINLTSLQVLHLEDNFISDFAIWSLNYNPHLLVVHISNNLWTCRCDFVSRFRDWMRTEAAYVLNKDTIRCHYNNTSIGPYIWQLNSSKCTNYSDNHLIHHPNQQPHQVLSGSTIESSQDGGYGVDSVVIGSSLREVITPSTFANEVPHFQNSLVQDYMPLTLILIIGLVVILLIIILISVYHKEIKVWIYSNYGLRFCQKSNYPPETERLFDGFVSYCKKDEAFISQILAPELEYGHPPYRLCLRYRDLPVTGYVAEAISEAIESSHRTIILLSDQYLKSDSCHFELKVAHQECQVNPNHKLIVVVLDKNSLNQLDADGKLCIRSSPIIHWGDRRFWEKLRYAMPPGRGLNKPLNCPDVRASVDFKRATNLNPV